MLETVKDMLNKYQIFPLEFIIRDNENKAEYVKGETTLKTTNTMTIKHKCLDPQER